MYKYIFALLCLPIIYAVELSGLVLSEDGEALFFANIKFIGETIQLTADVDGRFLVKGLDSGDYEIAFSMVSFQPETISVNIPDDGKYVEVILKEKAAGNVQLEPKTPKWEIFKGDISLSKWFLYTDDFENQALFKRDDPIYYVKKMPGVITVGKDYAGQPMIRGNGSDKAPLLLDNTPIYNPYHFGGLFSGIEPDYLRSIDLSTGAADAGYANWLGGAINMTTKKPPRNATHGRIRINPIWANFSLRSSSYLIDGLGFNLAYTGSFPLLDGDSTNTDNSFTFNDFYARVHLEPNFRWYISATGYNNFDSFKDEYSEMRYGSRAIFINSQNIINKELLIKSQLAKSSFKFKYTELGDPTIADTIESIHFSSEALYFAGQHDVRMGLKVINNDLSFLLFDFPEEREFTEISVYAEDEYTLNDNMILEFGTALGYISDFDKGTFDPNFSMKYFPKEDLAIELGAGTAHQVITSLWNPDFNMPFDFFVAPRKEISHSYNLSSSLEKWLSDEYSLKMGLFANYANNISRFPMEGIFSDLYYYPGDSRAKGIEMMLKKTGGKLNGFLTYTFMDADEIFEYRYHNPSWESSRFERKNSLYLSMNYKTKRFDFGTSIDYGSGLPTDYEEMDRVPDLFSWDMRIRANFNIGGFILSPYIELYNISQHENIVYIDEDGNGTKTLGLPGMFGIEGEF